MKPYLIPKINYKISFVDLFISTLGIFKSNNDIVNIRKLFNTRHVYFVNHARTGLRLLLNSLDLPPGARIGVQILNCHTVFNAIVKAGFKPVFIDINESLTLSLIDLKRKASQIDGLIVTHIFGMPAEIEKICDILKNKPIIEDCCHSFLSKRNDKLTGTFCDASIFSFGKGKFPSIGSGGFIIINEESLIPKFVKKYKELNENNLFDEFKNIMRSVVLNVIHNKVIYKYAIFPTKKRLGNKLQLKHNNEAIEKKVLAGNMVLFLKKIKKYEDYKYKQFLNATKLKQFLARFNFVSTLHVESNLDLNYIMLPVITNEKNRLINYFLKRGVEIGPHFNKCIEWANALGYKKSDCNNAEAIIPRLLLIPTYKSFNSIK